MRLSLRWRLTLWNALALAVVLAGFAALVYGLLARALYQQTDRRLLSGFHELAHDDRLESDPEGQMRHWAFELYEHERILSAVYGPQGEVLVRTEEWPESAVPPAPHASAEGPRLGDAELAILGRQRTLEGRIRLGGRDVTLLLLSPLAEVDDELRRLLTALVLAVPLALAASVGMGYLLARGALAPVERLRRSTQEVTAERLDRRLPVANPDDELGRLTRTINEMIGRLERSFAEVRRFTADASHELRTPLAAIRAEVEVALNSPSVPPDQERLLVSVLEECARLARLTDQLLALSREDAGVGRSLREPLCLSALVGGVVDNMRPLAESRGLTLLVKAVETIQAAGDGARLRQVFYNLLDNAIKHTPPGGTVEVAVAAGPEGTIVTVTDTGIGIAPEHLPHVFERFYRVDKARGRAEGGTGLGLSIARSIVVAHGGRIDIASTPGQGTTCTVTLPV